MLLQNNNMSYKYTYSKNKEKLNRPVNIII